jgi:hypothetical protein
MYEKYLIIIVSLQNFIHASNWLKKDDMWHFGFLATFLTA